MPNYSQTYIYKLCCKDPSVSDFYIGSTCNLYRRKAQHKHDCIYPNKKYNYPIYQFIREHGGWDNWTINVIEEVGCKNKIEKDRIEREWFERLKPTLNKMYCPRFIKNRDYIEYVKTKKHQSFIESISSSS